MPELTIVGRDPNSLPQPGQRDCHFRGVATAKRFPNRVQGSRKLVGLVLGVSLWEVIAITPALNGV